jgi:hypothetical protein
MGGVIRPAAGSAAAVRRLLAEQRPASPLTLLEMSELAPIPGVPQAPIPRYETDRPPSAVQQGFQDRRRLILRDVERGVAQGADQWYFNEPVRQQFIYELGDAEGNRQYDLFARMVAGSSSAAEVRPNIRKASWYRQQALQGLLPPGMDSKADAVAWIRANRPPQGYGSVAQTNDALWTSRLLGGDQLWRAALPGQPHKIITFDQNLRGNLRPWTGDRHEGARLGVPEVWDAREKKFEKGQLTPNEYVAAEKMMAGIADQVGLLPAQVQSARWIGGAPFTGVDSLDPSFPHALEATARAQAERMGETPEWVLRNFIRNGGLLAVPAAVMGDE